MIVIDNLVILDYDYMIVVATLVVAGILVRLIDTLTVIHTPVVIAIRPSQEMRDYMVVFTKLW